MKLALLAGQNSIHTVRWVNAMAQRIDEVHLITMHDHGDTIDSCVQIHRLPFNALHGYFLNVPALKAILKNVLPDLLHVHYASGYGTLGNLSGFHPIVLSVWGSDVYDFPRQNLFNRALVELNLRSADWVCSTSEVMAVQTKTICSDVKNLSITPFGVDTEKFCPVPTLKNDKFVTVGTVKRLTPKYGIDILIRSFAKVKSILDVESPKIASKLRLLIVGDGSQKSKLKSLAHKLGLQNHAVFVGAVPHEEVPHYLNQMDIYVAVSRLDSESFGVAVLEASACGIPVVVSDIGGLPEVVQNGITGYVVPSEDPNATSEAIVKLIENDYLRYEMGLAGRQLVLAQYEWNDNVTRMSDVYNQLLNS